MKYQIRSCRLSAPAICHCLAWLFKRSLDLGKLPLQWKTSKIMPISKKGPRITAANFWKILEAIVNRQLYEHLVCNDLLSPYQPGFRRGDSTSLQLFRVVHQLMFAVDSGKATAMVFLWLSQSFRHRLACWPSTETVWCLNWWQLYWWFTDYIRSRQQFVAVGCSVSSHGTPLAGVPQGFVLGPTPFILYINSITSATKLPSYCFADDTSTTAFASSLESLLESLQSDVDSVYRWSDLHKLSFHPEKNCFNAVPQP